MLVDVWVSRDVGSRTVDLWSGDPGELMGSQYLYNRRWMSRLAIELAERLGYGVAEGQKRHVRGEVRDVE